MMWRKRKKQRKMFQNAGCKNYKQYQQKLRFLSAAYTTNGCTFREFARRIKAAAEKIKKTCDVFIVIGIGGSYLGSRAVIEFIKSPLYNNIKSVSLYPSLSFP